MSPQSPSPSNITDEQLVAFADKKCSADQHVRIAKALENNADLQTRFAQIMAVNTDDLIASYEFESQNQTKTEANTIADLEAFIDAQPLSAQERPAPNKTNHIFRRPLLVASIAAALLVGTASGVFLTKENLNTRSEMNWRESVAVYQMLYTKQTLASISLSSGQITTMQKRLQKLSGFDIQFYDLKAHGLNFKRGQILKFKGRKLVQLAYLSNAGIPVAICFIAQPKVGSDIDNAIPPVEVGKSEIKPQLEQRHGLNIVHWVKSGTETMVIGDMPPQTLKDIFTQILEHPRST